MHWRLFFFFRALNKICWECYVFGDVTVTFTIDYPNLISSCLNPSECFCQIWRNVLNVFLKYHAHENETDWTVGYIMIQSTDPGHSSYVFGITIMFQSIDAHWAWECFLCQTSVLRKPTASCTLIEMGKLTTLHLTIFSFLWQLGSQLSVFIDRTGHIPFTVLTKTCFSLLGSFSSSSTPWKMRPNVPVKHKPQVFIRGKGQEKQSQRHHIQGSKCHRCRWPSCLAGLWTEVDRLLLKMLCLLMGLGRFGSRLADRSQNKSKSVERRGSFITSNDSQLCTM